MAAALAGVNTAGRARLNRSRPGSSQATLKDSASVAHHPSPRVTATRPAVTRRRGPTVSASRPVVIESSGLPSPVRATTSPDTAAVAPIPSSR